MKENENNNEIESLLKQMPKIQDHQDEDVLYSKVQSQLKNQKEETPKKHFWKIPALTSAALILLAIIVISVIQNQNHPGKYVQNEENSITGGDENSPVENGDGSVNNSTMMTPEANSESTANGESSSLPKSKDLASEAFSGLKTGMTYEEVIEVIGSPIEYEDTDNQRSLKYSGEGYGVQLKMNSDQQTVEEFTFKPQFLQNAPDRLTLDKLFLSETIDEIKSLLGEPGEVESVSCFENATCEEFIYSVSGGYQIIIRTSWNHEDIEYIKLLRQDNR
ncbi:hypothetical protein SAMN05421676_11054 [Salinibacillus kushneri]|uniref:Uncharacterized protein n=1 Tax=Salinibacillus kushneri TaxID=237682 RepID=A0A1I0I0W2_9BACI|nr:hypothetical protein [Salinibacillus kushneri]SET89290.1 hypothetical protein SAMN05421676_11054 [Salinibacillus kushneri]